MDDSRRGEGVAHPRYGGHLTIMQRRCEPLRGARAQVAGYLADEGLPRRAPSARRVGPAVVFHRWERAACEAVEPEADGEADAAQ